MDTTGGSPGIGGGFQRLGDFIRRRPVVVIGLWIALAAVLSVTFPSLQQMVREHPVDIVPGNAPAAVTARQMTETFHEAGSDHILLVVLIDEKGLTRADEDIYRRLVENLRHDTRDVLMLQDFLSTPSLRDSMTSDDRKAWFLPVGLAGGDTPQSIEPYTHVADIVKKTTAGTTLTANLTGPAATLADMTDVGERDLHLIEIATAVMVLTILLVVYRNPVTMLLPLITIGISMGIAEALVAGMSQLGLGVSNQTVVFMTGIMIGAGTDYAVFLISRYHEWLRRGVDSDQAVVRALTSIGKVIAASAATVAVTFLGMVFTKLAFFAATGPALAVSVAVVFFAAVTLLPAILVLAGRRGWVAPRRDLTSRFWRRSGVHIVRRPKTHLVASLIVLTILASCATLIRYNYDNRKDLPTSSESNQGYAAMDRHFRLNSAMPQYLLVQSPRDLRSPEALADLEQMAQRVSQVPDIDMVRGITRPTGKPPKEATTSYQAGQVGGKLQDASDLIADRSGDLNRLASGADQLANSLGAVRAKVTEAIATARAVIEKIRSQLSELASVRDDGTLDRITDVARQVDAARGTENLELAADSLRQALDTLSATLQSSKLAGARGQLASVQNGANQLAAGSRQLANGVRELVEQTKKMGVQLEDASSVLLGMQNSAIEPSMGGFYIPPQVLTRDDFKKAARAFVSPDGHAVRYLVQSKLNPFSTAAMDQVNVLTDAARSAQPNTTLADASISMTGYPAMLRDIRNDYNHDIRFIILMTTAVVLLILIMLLRAIVAPLYLIASVVISYVSALGIGVIIFQFILHEELSWTVPGMAFIVLVAVGADYNMLLISRIRDESPYGVRSGVIRTVGSTGGVITSAGVIFAASMFGLLFGSIDTMVQFGFIIGMGLLLDTFLVRTIMVPAMAVLVGRANWWPSWRWRAGPQFSRLDSALRAISTAFADRLQRGKAPATSVVSASIRRAAKPASGGGELSRRHASATVCVLEPESSGSEYEDTRGDRRQKRGKRS